MLTARLCALVLRAIQTHRLQDRCLGLSGACPTSSPLYQLAESDAEQTALCVLVKTKEPKIETGNLTRDNAGRTFTYDLENRQKTFNGTTYVYDGEGRRAEKVAGGRTTIFVYNASGQLVADYSGLPPSETSGTSYVTADHL